MAHLSPMKLNESAFFPLSMPQGVEFGWNLMIFDCGPKFRGIGMIPKGLHFVCYSCGMGLRQGYFIDLTAHDVLLRSWDPQSESLSTSNVLSQGSTEEFMKTLYRGELNEFIGAYNIDDHHTWLNLTKFITTDVLLKCRCACSDATKGFSSLSLYAGEDKDIEAELLKVMSRPENAKAHSEHGKFKLKHADSDSPLPQVPCYVDMVAIEKEYVASTLVPALSTDPARVSAFHLDKSDFLDYLLRREYGGSWVKMLGELQLAFVLFLNLYSAPSLRHWQNITNLICACDGFMHDHAEFTACFIRLLFHQLNFAPYDFFMEEISKNNFLRGSLSNLMRSLQEGIAGAGEVSLAGLSAEDAETLGDYFSAEDGASDSLKTVQECKRRLLLFLRKKFGIFDQDCAELGDYTDRLIALSRSQRDGVGAGAGVGAARTTVSLSIDELYNLDYDDLPVIVDEEEYRRYEELQQLAADGSDPTVPHNGGGLAMAVDRTGECAPATPQSVATEKWSVIDERLAGIPSQLSSPAAPPAPALLSALPPRPPVDQRALAHCESSMKSCPQGQPASGSEMQLQHENSRFGWRYPLLCDEQAHLSTLRGAKLDLAMTARLVLDEYVCDSAPPSAGVAAPALPSTPSAFLDEAAIKQSFLRRVREEATFFLENECSFEQ